ncbi:hypothetical protein FBY35_4687 [Streptomyces sp. SLBN-118]|uniref:hypothetical protein n=1 Tax=Streptomyces sp. SLBN-118 TaxID=2768454 RepID=UPI00114E6FA2|nr:hypothetical protein [Streptomyces sp. SLBN-118]TQK43230.1 hypothetical protein FBY35_4687 [Streptomyces sp. SLBN-118]
MAYTKQSTRRRNKATASMRRTLRREVPSTVALIADEYDFSAMRRYRTFTFDDHSSYLRQIEALLKTLASRQLHTTVALFDPEDFAEYCTEAGLDPDAAASRSRYTAAIAARGATLAYTGQPVTSLLPPLINNAVRQATWEYATMLLADLGHCADCGQDIGRASFDRASRILMSLLDGAGPGRHHMVCSIPAPDEQLIAVLHAEGAADAAAQLDASDGAEFVTVLATGIALETPGGVVLRTSAEGSPDRLRGWRLHAGGLVPLTAGEVFSAYCTDATTGEPLSPEPGVEYCAGFAITADDPDNHH